MVLSKNKKLVLLVFGGLAVLNIVTWSVVWDLNEPGFLEVVFFDVGQGDSIFIETPVKHRILIDGGPSSVILERLADETPFYDRTIDLIILTHPESDHLFGLLEVLKRYKVKNILWTGIIRETAEWQEWKRLIEKEGAEIKIAKSGQKIIFPAAQNPHDRENFGQVVFMEISHPSENLEGHVFKDSNDTSIVAKLVFGEVSFLFTGDITKRVEKDLEINSDILKVAHHGSKTSSGLDFLEAVSPEIAVISVGENWFGHPHPEVLANLEKFAIKILRTDINGDIKFVSDGNSFKIKNQK